jgi:hypothetical protein
MKNTRRRWLRWLRWAGIFVAVWVTVVPTIQLLWIRHRVLSAVRSAQSVRLEEFSFGKVLTSVEFTSNDSNWIRPAMPIRPDIGCPGMIDLCFIPHHRIVTRDRAGLEWTFTICFHCDEGRIGRGNIFMTPYLWRSSLRRLFTENHVPIRAEYSYSEPATPQTY